MAREKVTTDGYLFKKGHSRSKHTSSDSDEPPCKRKKIDTEERAREIKLLQDNLETLDSRLRIKQQLLEKARSHNNFKQCDEILGDMMKVRKERATIQNQFIFIYFICFITKKKKIVKGLPQQRVAIYCGPLELHI